MSQTRSVHFAPIADVQNSVQAKPPARERSSLPDRKPAGAGNALSSYSHALVDAELVRDKLRGLLNSQNRHGELQVVLSAAKRIEASVKNLIDLEEVV